MDGLELLTSVFLDDLARNPTATREENPAGAAPDSDAPPGSGTRPMSPPSTQPTWTASAPPFLGAPAFRARQSLSRQGQDRRCLLAPLSTPAYSSASTPAVRWRATSFAQPYMWASLRKHLPFPHPGAAGVSLYTLKETKTTQNFSIDMSIRKHCPRGYWQKLIETLAFPLHCASRLSVWGEPNPRSIRIFHSRGGRTRSAHRSNN